MRAYRLALATVAATFGLLVLGGLVQASGAALACPDWPLCKGRLFPLLADGVAVAWGHRLAASAVALLTAALAVAVHRREERDPGARALALGAVALVAAQAALGAISVARALPVVVASAHLALSMAFLSLLLALAARLRPAELPAFLAGPRRLVGAAAVATYLLLVLGAVVRYAGAGLACGGSIPLCDGALWPAGGAAQLHMLHRYAAASVGVLVLAAAARPGWLALRAGALPQLVLALGAPALLLLQVGLGQLAVLAGFPLSVAAVHLGMGALLLADLVALYLSLAPAPAPRRAPARLAAAPW